MFAIVFAGIFFISYDSIVAQPSFNQSANKSSPNRSKANAVSVPIFATSAAVQGEVFFPLRIGITGGVSGFFTEQALLGLPNFPEPFFRPLRDTLMQGWNAGVELEYSLLPWLALGARGSYAQMQGEAIGTTLVPIAGTREPVNMQGQRIISGQPAPVLILRRETLTFSTENIEATLFARARLWNILTLSIGGRFTSIYQMPLSYTLESDSLIRFLPINGAPLRRSFVQTSNYAGRTQFSSSFVLGIGATLPLGRLTLVPEIQVQTQYRPFDNVAWNILAVRGSLSVLLNFPAPPAPLQAPPLDSTGMGKSNTLVNANDSSRSTAIKSSTSSSVSALQGNLPQSTNRQKRLVERIDTALKRDTVFQIGAWYEEARVLLKDRTETRVNEQRRETPTEIRVEAMLDVRELYMRRVPKPRPFLAASLNVRFIPNAGAAKSQESMQASRLLTHRMFIRRFSIDTLALLPLKARIYEQSDTLDVVKMPILRLQPEISGELGIESSVVDVFSLEGTSIERFAVESKRMVDWDMQHIFLKNSSSALSNIVDIVSSGKPLLGVLTASDAEGQVQRSDTVRIRIEAALERSPASLVSARTQKTTSYNTTQTSTTASISAHTPIASRSHWLVTQFPVPKGTEQNDSDAGESMNEQLFAAFASYLPRGKRHPCTLYVNASNNEASAVQYAENLAARLRGNALPTRIIRRAQALSAEASVEIVVPLAGE
ncbi:MAG: hypothetical protein EAZ92_13060 [Candidatus Kapaibacterium sp.]|nr:MAG: hypothetical protein EAZ92_13060 [Candidatus Kapabacteria bacterium]